jgi:hypothetical protein
MKCGAQAALAVGAGYILGRRRKMRLAAMLAAGAATGAIGKVAPVAIRRGAKYLGSTDIAGALGPQVGEIVNTLRGDLLDAAKAAATSAVTSRVDSLTESLHDRAETLRNPEEAVGRAGEAAGETVGRAGKTAGRAGKTAGETVGRAGRSAGRLRRRGRPVDEEEAVGEYDEQDEEERGNGQVRRESPRTRRSARPEPDEYEEPRDEYEDEVPEDEVPEDEVPEDEVPEDELDEAPAGDVDELGEEDEPEADEPVRPRRRTSRSPVARTRR